MQSVGMEFDPHLLQKHESHARARMAECENEAAALAGMHASEMCIVANGVKYYVSPLLAVFPSC